METYQVNASRDGRFWVLDIPAIERATQARFKGEAEIMARDCIAVMLEVPLESVAVQVNWPAAD